MAITFHSSPTRPIVRMLAAAVFAAALSVVVLAVAQPAAARDSNAPDGASQRWLPCDGWAMYHWLPFDRRLLMRRLGVSESELRDWLRIDHVRPLDALARKRGVDAAALRAELMQPWERKLSGARLAAVRENVDAMFTQGHLASHMLFHTFHHAGLAMASRQIFGVSISRYLKLRNKNATNRDLAISLGIRPATAARRMRAVVRHYLRVGRHRNLIVAAEARKMTRDVRANSRWWLGHKLENDHGVARSTARALRRTRGRTKRVCLVFAGPHDAAHQRGAAHGH